MPFLKSRNLQNQFMFRVHLHGIRCSTYTSAWLCMNKITTIMEWWCMLLSCPFPNVIQASSSCEHTAGEPPKLLQFSNLRDYVMLYGSFKEQWLKCDTFQNNNKMAIVRHFIKVSHQNIWFKICPNPGYEMFSGWCRSQCQLSAVWQLPFEQQFIWAWGEHNPPKQMQTAAQAQALRLPSQETGSVKIRQKEIKINNNEKENC